MTYGFGIEAVLPQEVIESAQARGRLGVDLIISSVQANRVFLETQELLFISQDAPVGRVADVIRMGQPLHIILIRTYTNDQYINPQEDYRQRRCIPVVQNA